MVLDGDAFDSDDIANGEALAARTAATAPFSENAAKDLPRPRYRAALSTRALLDAPFFQATSTTMAAIRRAWSSDRRRCK